MFSLQIWSPASDWAGEAEGEGNIVISLVSQETGDWHLPPAEVRGL